MISIWKNYLEQLLAFYINYRKKTSYFFLRLFIFFIVVNVFCYWLAMVTVFRDLLVDQKFWYYFKIQFPVGFLGALFDSLSFFVTIYIVKRALKQASTLQYISHLSIDFIIAILATGWVLFVFIISGWLISFTEFDPQLLQERSHSYETMVISAVEAPAENWRNIYFGLVMGISAMLPTLTHFSMALYSLFKYLGSKK